MMKKRPVSQADQVPQNEDSATQKQLVLVRMSKNLALSDFLFPAHQISVPLLGFPIPCDSVHSGPPLSSPHTSSHVSPSLSCVHGALSPTQTLHLLPSPRDSSTHLSDSIQNNFISFKEKFFHSL